MTGKPDARTLVAEALGCPPESLKDDSQLGVHPRWDSFGHLNVMMALEQQFGVEITDDTIRHFQRFAAIVELVDERP